MEAQTSTVDVVRRQELYFGGGSREYLNESPLDTFRLKVKADLASLDKMVWSFRSPSAGLLCHPLAWLEMKFDITTPAPISLANQTSAGLTMGTSSASATGVLLTAPHQEVANQFRIVRECCLIGLADGDGVGQAIDHISCVLNGSTFTMNSCDKFWNSLVKATLSSKDAAKRFADCGGAYDQADSRGSKVFTKNANDRTARNHFSGYGYGVSQDSGVASRCRAFWSMIESTTNGADNLATAGSRPTYRVKVRWPINIPPFNPFYGIESMHRLSPWASQPLGLSGINQVQISILYKNLAATLFRDFTARVYGGAALRGTQDHSNSCTTGILNDAIDVKLVEDECNLMVKYYRLQSHRNVPAVQSISVPKFMVSTSTKFPIAAVPASGIAVNAGASVFEAGTAYLAASGRDQVTVGIHGASASMKRQLAPQTAFYEVEINNVSYPQLPEFLIFAFEKDKNVYSHKRISDADDEGLRPILNRSSNGSIRKLALQIQTSEHVYSYTSEVGGNPRDQQVLYEDTVRNCCRDYFGYRQWQETECVLVLSSDTYCPLGLSPGVVSPVQISVSAQIENKAVFYDAGCPVVGTAQADNGAHVDTRQELALGTDRIPGQLVMIGAFTRGVATISPSSCVLSTMAIAQSQASEILSRQP